MPAPNDEWIARQIELCERARDGAYPGQYAKFAGAAHYNYPLVLQLLKETRGVLLNVRLELDHMVSHNPECLCDEDCQEQARDLLNRHEGLETADASSE